MKRDGRRLNKFVELLFREDLSYIGAILGEMKSSASYLLLGGLFAAIYTATAVFGLNINAVGGFATLVWLPTGISLFVLLQFGLRFWPAILLGAIATNIMTGAPFPVAVGIGVGNTLEAFCAAYILKKYLDFSPTLSRIRDVVGLFIVAGILGTALSATIGVLSLVWGGVIPTTSVLSTWTAWWIGDMLSNMVIAPFLLIWSSTKLPTRPRLAPSLEMGALVIMLSVVLFLIFRWGDRVSSVPPPITYLIFPPLIWASLRFRQRESITITFLVSSIAIWSTLQGYGPFIRESVSESLLYLQSFMGVIAGTTLLLAAAVSERKLLERKKDEFISIASHELKTPLTSLKIFSELLEHRIKKQTDKKSLFYIDRIRKQVEQLTALVLQLLDSKKFEQGKMLLHYETFNLVSLLSELIKDVSKTSPHRIIFKAPTSLKIRADKHRIAQVCMNLLSNAIKYSPDADKIIVRATAQSEYVKVSVQDFGNGIPLREQRRIFDRFYQVKKTKDASLGLGLYISQQIIAYHQGRIWVQSSRSTKGKGSGSTFYFSLPIKKPE